jgi:ABC-type transport system substrate-binding protein
MRGSVLVLLAVGFALGLAPGSSAEAPPSGTFVVDEPSTYIDTIDGGAAGLAGDYSFLSVACASLMRQPDRPLPGGFGVEPELAARLPTVSRDGKRYVFTIRSGSRFSTGAPVTAADVAFTINRDLDPAVRSPLGSALSGIVGAQAVLKGKADEASGVIASAETLTIQLTKPDGGFLYNGAAGLCVLPAGTPVQAGGVTAPVPSAAPYFISEYVPGQQIVLDRNPYYRGPRPQRVARFQFNLSGDENQAIDAVLNGTADFAWVPNNFLSARAPALARRFGVNKGRFFVEPGTFLRMLVLNTSRPLFRNNAPLRQAINFAIDRSALASEVGPHVAVPVDHYLLPIMPGYRNIRVYPSRPDLARARALARGHTRSGTLVFYVNNRPGLAGMAQIVKQDLARIGLQVQIVTFPAGALYFQRIGNPKEPFDMAWSGWQINDPDPGGELSPFFDGGAIGTPGNADLSYFDSPAWNKALRHASTLSGKARNEAYGRLDIELARDAAPAVPFAVDNSLALVSARTGCVVVNPNLDLDAVCLKG